MRNSKGTYLVVGANLHAQVEVYKCLLKRHLRIIQAKPSPTAILPAKLERFRPYRGQEGVVRIGASQTRERFSLRVSVMREVNEVG